MSFTKTWNETIPPNTEAVGQGGERIRDFKTAIRERLAIDHNFKSDETGDDDIGKHNQVSLLVQSSEPSAPSSGMLLYVYNGNLYVKKTSGSPVALSPMDGSNISDNSIAGSKLQIGAVGTNQMADNSISTNKIQDNAITKPKIATLNGVLQYTDTHTISNDTDIPHKKYVDDKVSGSGNYIYTAVGTTDISTSSTSYVDMSDMSITQTFSEGTIFINFDATFTRVSDTYIYIRVLIDNTEVKKSVHYTEYYEHHCISYSGSITAGSHTIKIQWCKSGNTIYQNGSTYKRILTVITGQ